MFKKVDAFYMKVTLMMSLMIIQVTGTAFAAAVSDDVLGGYEALSGRHVEWPWTRFLTSLAEELTGPLPMILGILGIAIAAISLLQGNGGAGTQKAFMLIMAVSVAMFTPSLISYISESASGATIDMVTTAATIAPPLLP